MNPIHVPRIAVLSTVFHPASHTDVIVSRWLEPFPTDAAYGWGAPVSRIASLYVEQRTTTTDLTSAASLRYGVPVFRTIAEALTLGGDELAVDGVLLIGEHGDYPINAFQQKLYPRKEFFDQMMAVFDRAGRVVPVFLDKHLSWNPEWIREMAGVINQRKIPFFAGSSLPHSLPNSLRNLRPDTVFEEVAAVYFSSLEAYFFHSAEFVECVIERRASAEPGIAEITAWKDAAVWDAVDRGAFAWDLVEAACASSSAAEAAAIQAHRASRGPACAFTLRYRDGLQVTHLMQNVVRKWCLGARVSGQSEPITGTALSAGAEHYYPHFARLCRMIDDFVVSGQSPVPLTRTYATSMTTALAMRALAQPGVALATPELDGILGQGISGQRAELRVSPHV